MFGRRREAKPDQVLIAGGVVVPFERLKTEARQTRDSPTASKREVGLAMALLAALAEVEHEDGPVQHEVVCPSCGATIRARMADRP